jgi:hypothetical protein
MNDMTLPGKAGINRHPIDQLANVRATIKVLQARETELKDEITALMGDKDSLGGDEFIARQKLQERKGGLDEKKLADKFGDLSAYRKPSTTFITIQVEPRALDL